MHSITSITFLALTSQAHAEEKSATISVLNAKKVTTPAVARTSHCRRGLDGTVYGKVKRSPSMLPLEMLAKMQKGVQLSSQATPLAKALRKHSQFLPSFHPACDKSATLQLAFFEKRASAAVATLRQRREKNIVANAVACKATVTKKAADEDSAMEPLFALDITPQAELPDSHDPRTSSGRWRYIRHLGTGSNAEIYHAFDMVGKLGDVAIKVAKNTGALEDEELYRRLNAFLLHREAVHSIGYIHNPRLSTFDDDSAQLFAKYLEDHTGDWSPLGPFEAQCDHFENPDFDWWSEPSRLNLAPTPYVVMELVRGTTLNEAMYSGDAPVNETEGRSILAAIAKAIEYLYRCGLIHRDIHENNVIVKRDRMGLSMRIIDLGLAIPADERHRQNLSPVVHSDLGEQTWAPPEVKAYGNGTNFALPAFSYDMYSLGILIQLIAKHLSVDGAVCTLGLPQSLMMTISVDPQSRPEPHAVLVAIEGASGDDAAQQR